MDTKSALSRTEQYELRLVAMYSDWHYMSPVVTRGYLLDALAAKGLIETRWVGGPVWPKREARLTDTGRGVAAGLPAGRAPR